MVDGAREGRCLGISVGAVLGKQPERLMGIEIDIHFELLSRRASNWEDL